MTETRLIFYPAPGRGATMEARVSLRPRRHAYQPHDHGGGLGATFAAVPAEAKPAEYASAIIDENCLGKQTLATRRLSLQHLTGTLRARPGVAGVSHLASALGDSIAPGRPLLALLAGLSRDPLLMATAETVIGMAEARNSTERRCGAPEKFVGERMNESTLTRWSGMRRVHGPSPATLWVAPLNFAIWSSRRQQLSRSPSTSQRGGLPGRICFRMAG